jgi:hypothetical protein
MNKKNGINSSSIKKKNNILKNKTVKKKLKKH